MMLVDLVGRTVDYCMVECRGPRLGPMSLVLHERYATGMFQSRGPKLGQGVWFCMKGRLFTVLGKGTGDSRFVETESLERAKGMKL